MKFNKLFITFLVCFAFASQAFGQRAQDRQRIKTIKIAFLTERLSLSSDEAEIFWPLYNEYQAEKQRLRETEKREIHQALKNRQDFSESEARSLLELYLSLEEEQEELDKDFIQEMSKTLSARKTLMLFKAEADFKHGILTVVLPKLPEAQIEMRQIPIKTE